MKFNINSNLTEVIKKNSNKSNICLLLTLPNQKRSIIYPKHYRTNHYYYVLKTVDFDQNLNIKEIGLEEIDETCT